ncbi:hypothetical protein CDV31_017229 [Fusarium ambrosium]|uniref:Uncharacterized protein n=1 Tax=Fusarium ambrosium TaxID=131363 RepID=A0A428RNM3_9HYPO|nr:hypothetical protein CDV31_017229 [Fusarium ambrosium]
MDNQDLVTDQYLFILITIASRAHSDDWQHTLHQRLRDGDLRSIYQDIAGQIKLSLEELIQLCKLRDYDAGDYDDNPDETDDAGDCDDEPDETEDLEMRLGNLGIDATFTIYGDLRDRKILACIASGMNKNVVRDLNNLDEAEVTRVLENITKQLQDRKNVGGSDILSEGSVDCMAWEARYREKIREARYQEGIQDVKDNHSDREVGGMLLVLRLKNGDAGMGRDVGSEHGSYM